MSYAKQVAEAVRDAMIDAWHEADEIRELHAMANVDLDAIIASVPKPEPVGYFTGEFGGHVGENGAMKFVVRAYDAIPEAGSKIYAEPIDQSARMDKLIRDLERLSSDWANESCQAIPVDAMLINKKVRELWDVIAKAKGR